MRLYDALKEIKAIIDSDLDALAGPGERAVAPAPRRRDVIREKLDAADRNG